MVDELVTSAQASAVNVDMVLSYGDKVFAPTLDDPRTPLLAQTFRNSAGTYVDFVSHPLEICHAVHILGLPEDLQKVRPRLEAVLQADAQVVLSSDVCLSVSHACVKVYHRPSLAHVNTFIRP